MKGSRWFILFILAFLVIMFAVEYSLPKKFVWVPTFSHHDEQPFGCAVFDSLLSASLPHGYGISRKSFYQLEAEDTTTHRGILVIADNLILSEVDVKALLKMAERGNKIMLVGNFFGKYLEDTLEISSYSGYFNPMMLKKYVAAYMKKDSIYWAGDSAIYPHRKYYFYPQFCLSYFWGDSLPDGILAQKTISSDELRYQMEIDSLAAADSLVDVPVAVSFPWKKGELILVSTPLLFTNYGVLDGKNATYIFRLLSQMGELPILRTEGYMKETAQVQQSPFRYFLSQQPLRWALYLTFIAILLFMIFTAKRRQRAIPVVREPENKSLEFTELIGTLYYQRTDHADLVRKKFTYFAEELRREIQVDVEEIADDERSFHRIAQKTGMGAEEIAAFIREIRPVIYGGRVLTVEQMKQYIDKMNEIINHI